MTIRQSLVACLLAFVPSLVLAGPLTITSMPTDATGDPGAPLRHNVFHDATVAGGAGGDVLAWFDLNPLEASTWDPVTGELDLFINIYADAAQTIFLGTGTGTSSNLSGFGDDPDSTLAFIDWTFLGGAAALLGSGLTMEFIDHIYASAPDSAGNLPNTYVGNTVTLWGADGDHDGNGGFDGATLGVDMVFNVTVPEPATLLLMAIGLLGFGATTRRR